MQPLFLSYCVIALGPVGPAFVSLLALLSQVSIFSDRTAIIRL